MTTVDLAKCLVDKEEEYKIKLAALNKLEDDIKTIRRTIELLNPASSGSPVASGSPDGFTPVKRKGKSKNPDVTKTFDKNGNVVTTFNWSYLYKEGLEADIHTIRDELNKGFETYNPNDELVLVQTKVDSIYVVCRNTKTPNPNVNEYLDWGSRVPPNMVETAKQAVKSVESIINADYSCHEFILLHVEKTKRRDNPYNFTFMLLKTYY